MITINVTTRTGEKLQLESAIDEPLMHTLRDNDVGVEAVCGGTGSCATCHVYVDPGTQVQLDAPDALELDLLGSLIHTKPESRLSCQIVVTPQMDDMACELAPFEG